MIRSLKREIKLKDGRVYAKGQSVAVNFFGDTEKGARVCEIKILGVTDMASTTFRTSIANLPLNVTGFAKPSMQTLEKWSNDGICKTPTGKKTEPDGYGEDGSPSWLLALGYM